MYFSKFPAIFYTQDNNVSLQIIADITRRITLSKELKDNNAFYDLYDVKDGETPEIVSARMYGNAQYHWIILLANDTVDPRFDWPLSQVNLVEYCRSKYGDSQIYSTHHYIDTNGNEVNSNAPGATSVSNFQFEDSENEKKRRIKVLKSEIVSELVSNFENLINQ